MIVSIFFQVDLSLLNHLIDESSYCLTVIFQLSFSFSYHQLIEDVKILPEGSQNAFHFFDETEVNKFTHTKFLCYSIFLER